MEVIGTPDFNYLDVWVNTFGNMLYFEWRPDTLLHFIQWRSTLEADPLHLTPNFPVSNSTRSYPAPLTRCTDAAYATAPFGCLPLGVPPFMDFYSTTCILKQVSLATIFSLFISYISH